MKHIKTCKALCAWMELLLFQVSLSLLCLVHMCPQLNKKTQDICFVYYEGSLVDSISLSSMLNPFLCLLFRCGSLSQAAMLFGRLFEGRTEGMTAVISSGFNIPEFRIVESFVPFAASMVTKMPALPAYIFLGAAAAVVFVCRNSHETEFKPDVKTALFTIAALFWSVMSFTGISSFIYAGF